MKTLFILFSLFICNIVFAQDTKRYSFPHIGWTIDLPTDFIVSDSTGSKAYLKEAVDMANGINDIKLDTGGTIVLIVASKNDNNFNAYSTPFNPKRDGNWMQQHENMKALSYKTIQTAIPGVAIDTVSSTIKIDNIVFEKYVTMVKANGAVALTVVALSQLYKGYDLGITYSYNNEMVKQEIEAMLAASKFQQ